MLLPDNDISKNPQAGDPPSLRAATQIGAVNYLNSKPLIFGFDDFAKNEKLSCDLPSRLADALQKGQLDVALIPTYEALRDPSYRLVSDACIAAEGPVSSVKLYFRIPPAEVTCLALDEGSRTSAALSQLLLWRRYEVRPRLTKLPIGSGPGQAVGDAVLLIGDRAMREPDEPFVTSWDLSEEWYRDTGLPFVFACWTARSGVDTSLSETLLMACRDAGCDNLSTIAQREAKSLGLTEQEAEHYLRHYLRYHLGPQERAGLEAFRLACQSAGLLDVDPPLGSSAVVSEGT